MPLRLEDRLADIAFGKRVCQPLLYLYCAVYGDSGRYGDFFANKKFGEISLWFEFFRSLKSSTKCFRMPQIDIGVTYILPLHILCFMFHFYVSTYWLSILLKDETYDFYVSLLVSMFHTKNTEEKKQNPCGSDSKTLRERFHAPSVFWKMKHETKNETWKINQKFWKCMDIMWD